jgi:hypothetical protein
MTTLTARIGGTLAYDRDGHWTCEDADLASELVAI